MSLSQKHAGKILVPWFNVAEWKHVYRLIYFEPYRNWSKALDILTIWKSRTPLLSAGVEGTIILLQALLSDRKKLTDYEFTHIYSTALIRFLNLCAANSKKQGTFYKTAVKNDLPHWLISIRHEIAHSHKLPSKSMLILCLEYSLNWLKSKYWQVQFNLVKDLIVEKTRPELFEEAVYVYVELIQSEIYEDYHIDKDDIFIEHVNKITADKPKLRNNYKKILKIVLEIIEQGFSVEPELALNIICNQLIHNHVLFTTDIKKNTKQLPEDFVSAWTDILTIIYNAQVLEGFLFKLLNVTLNEICDDNIREVASLWIKTIFTELNMVKNNENSSIFNEINIQNKFSFDKFVDEAITKASPYSTNFIQQILEYHQAPKNFIEDQLALSKALITVEKPSSNTIFTINDLNFDLNEASPMQIDENEPTEDTTKWRVVKDTTVYKNLPLGILPHQSRTKNPTLDI